MTYSRSLEMADACPAVLDAPPKMSHLDAYHQSPAEQARVGDLLSLIPEGVTSALDVGSRDGHITRLLANRISQVTALDLELPVIVDPRIHCVAGNAAAMAFPDRSFDLVFCAEVLEHIPEPALEAACREIARVSRRHVIIGVPYRQDIRHGRTTCHRCGRTSPPWGHVNSFDESRLGALFSSLQLRQTRFVGTAEAGTNALSAWLSDLARNPYGTYSQEEHCVHCSARLQGPQRLSTVQRALMKASLGLRDIFNWGAQPHGNWIHLLFERT